MCKCQVSNFFMCECVRKCQTRSICECVRKCQTRSYVSACANVGPVHMWVHAEMSGPKLLDMWVCVQMSNLKLFHMWVRVQIEPCWYTIGYVYDQVSSFNVLCTLSLRVEHWTVTILVQVECSAFTLKDLYSILCVWAARVDVREEYCCGLFQNRHFWSCEFVVIFCM